MGGVGAVVLAGGRSSRYGRDKLADTVDGRVLLDRAIASVNEIGADTVVVAVLAPDATRPLPPGVIVARDDRPFEGPLAGLAAGLAALPASVAVVVVVGGDMPTLRPAVLRRLVQAVEAGHDAVLLDDGRDARPLPSAYRRSVASQATTDLLDAGERRLRALPARLAAAVIPLADWQALDPELATLRDIDLPTDR
jgi:molybdopterin-guanine dinucleotide biosynthesis protein A